MKFISFFKIIFRFLKHIFFFLIWLSHLENLKDYLSVFGGLAFIVGLFISYGVLTNKPKIDLIPHNPIVAVDFLKFSDGFSIEGLTAPVNLSNFIGEHGYASHVIHFPNGPHITSILHVYDGYPNWRNEGGRYIYHYIRKYEIDVDSSIFKDSLAKAMPAERFNQLDFELNRTTESLYGMGTSEEKRYVRDEKLIFKSPFTFAMLLKERYGSTILDPIDKNVQEFFRDIFQASIEGMKSKTEKLYAYMKLKEARQVVVSPFEIVNNGKITERNIQVLVKTITDQSVNLDSEVLHSQGVDVEKIGQYSFLLKISALNANERILLVLYTKDHPISADLINVISTGIGLPNFALIQMLLFSIAVITLILSVFKFRSSIKKGCASSSVET